VGIIGAGEAGLVTAKELMQHGLEVSIFEKSDHVGGVWKYSPGSVMYASLRTNLPREIMAFDEDNLFSRSNDDRSFVTHEDVQTYLEDYSTKESITCSV
jgi:cation diffusion facilitator CzcD-associated flavoprotein CzcO